MMLRTGITIAVIQLLLPLLQCGQSGQITSETHSWYTYLSHDFTHHSCYYRHVTLTSLNIVSCVCRYIMPIAKVPVAYLVAMTW